jgi:hypothetical protein
VSPVSAAWGIFVAADPIKVYNIAHEMGISDRDSAGRNNDQSPFGCDASRIRRRECGRDR